MRVCVLASGSKGNITFVNTKSANILIDFGMNVKYVKEKLNSIGFSLNDINYILLSHTHQDHVNGLNTLIKYYKPNICLSSLMLEDLIFLKEYDNLEICDNEIDIPGLKIDFIKTSHDTSDSRGFVIHEEDSSMVYVTDTGYLNNKYFKKLENKNIYVFESNHEIEELQNSKYPIWLQKRIASDYGHLSNKTASYYLSKLIGPNTKKVFLAHLSQENNSEELALKQFNKTMNEYDLAFRNVECAKQNEASQMVIV